MPSILKNSRALKSPPKSFEQLPAPLTFWVLYIFEASNQNLIMKCEPSNEISINETAMIPILPLDLDNFDLTETASTGTCVDSFAVTTGSSRTYYTLCGTLTGQHSKFKSLKVYLVTSSFLFFQFILKLPARQQIKS